MFLNIQTDTQKQVVNKADFKKIYFRRFTSNLNIDSVACRYPLCLIVLNVQL